MKLKDARYVVEELPCGRAFVSKWGWGRKFGNVYDAERYAVFMNSQDAINSGIVIMYPVQEEL